jgi:hypothetical protein
MPYLYLRTTPEGRVIVGGEDEDFVNAKRRRVDFSKDPNPGWPDFNPEHFYKALHWYNEQDVTLGG